MSTDLHSAAPPKTADRRRAVRRAAVAAFVAAAAIAIQPITVFAIPWTALDPGWSDPTAKNDLAMSAPLGWLGAIYGIQALVLATAIVIAALALAPVLGERSLARAGRAGAFGWALLWLVTGGITAAMHSTAIAPALVSAQPDGGVRKMVGFAEILIMQGIAGAAGIGALVWLVAVSVCGRAAGLFGRGPTIVVGVFAVIMAALYVFGYAAGTALIVIVPLLVVACWLLVSARRAAQ